MGLEVSRGSTTVDLQYDSRSNAVDGNTAHTLRISHTADQVEASLEGDGPRLIEKRPFSFTLTAQDAEDIRWYLEDYRVYPVEPTPRIARRIEQHISEVGRELFKLVLAGSDVWDAVRERLADTRIEIETAAQCRDRGPVEQGPVHGIQAVRASRDTSAPRSVNLTISDRGSPSIAMNPASRRLRRDSRYRLASIPLSSRRSSMGRACCTCRPRISSSVTGLAGADRDEDLSRCVASKNGRKVPGLGVKSDIGLILSQECG
jgi:hypothetical protein